MQITTPNDDIGIRLAAEDFPESEFIQYHIFSKTDEHVIRRLMVSGPVLLRGPRGSGKSAYMLAAHQRMKTEEITSFSVYMSLRHFPLLVAPADEYIKVLIPYVVDHIRKEVIARRIPLPTNFEKVDSINELREALGELGTALQRRIILMFDDVAHIGRETSLAGFFDFFRTISSSVVSCKAAIYPGVTKFGVRFDFYSDATVVEAQRDERSPDFAEFFTHLLKVLHPQILDKTEGKLVAGLGELLGRAVLGNVRAFNAVCNHLESYSVISIHRVGDSLKWLASNYLYPALEELRTKLGAYTPMLEIAEEISQIIFADCGKRKVNSMVVHRDHVQRIGKVFEILEYTGFIAKREASRSLAKSGSGRGPRYALSLGPLFEQVHGSTLSYELIASFLRISVANEEMVEYAPSSELSKFSYPEPENEVPLDILKLPIERLQTGHAIPYGLTPLMITALANGGYKTVEDVVKVPMEKLKELPQIWDAKALRIRNAVEQAIWM
jgi:hypothetical protein